MLTLGRPSASASSRPGGAFESLPNTEQLVAALLRIPLAQPGPSCPLVSLVFWASAPRLPAGRTPCQPPGSSDPHSHVCSAAGRWCLTTCTATRQCHLRQDRHVRSFAASFRSYRMISIDYQPHWSLEFEVNSCGESCGGEGAGTENGAACIHRLRPGCADRLRRCEVRGRSRTLHRQRRQNQCSSQGNMWLGSSVVAQAAGDKKGVSSETCQDVYRAAECSALLLRIGFCTSPRSEEAKLPPTVMGGANCQGLGTGLDAPPWWLIESPFVNGLRLQKMPSRLLIIYHLPMMISHYRCGRDVVYMQSTTGKRMVASSPRGQTL